MRRGVEASVRRSDFTEGLQLIVNTTNKPIELLRC